MYLEGQLSTLEVLASSENLSDFVNKEEYRTSVQEKIKETLNKITELKHQLSQQKNEVEVLLKEKQELQNQILSQRNEQNRLLGLNQSQQSSLNKEIKDNFARITELKRQQAIENARLFGGGSGQLGGGGYPWGYAACYHTGQVEGPCPNYDWAVNGSIWNWQTGGYGYRNCTDWVAYRVRVAGGYVPSGLGNAKLWDDRAPAYGYTVSGTPREGAAAVSNSGFYGHVMYVEAVNSDGSIVVSDYNRAGTGKYDMNQLSASTASNLNYVYF
jgi:surface antigen